MDMLYLLIGIVLGGTATGVAFFYYYKSTNPLKPEEIRQLESERAALQIAQKLAEGKLANLQEESSSLRNEIRMERELNHRTSIALATRTEELKNLNQRLHEQKTDLESLQEKFQNQFKNLANEILEEKTKKFTDQNKINLGEILTPLREKIIEFERKVESTNKESIERNSALKEQIIGLRELNLQITKEAENLTKALKGESKTRGNWGEYMLESILEKSGLAKGEQYEVQVSMTNPEGRRLQPDVVVRLPAQKNIIIDSKVSLNAYERYCNADVAGQRELEIKNHLLSIRSHIKGLSEKNYQAMYQIGSLDFVLLFMPIEPAFSLAVQHDTELFLDAYDRNIVIVSPSTLIATLRTIASIWRQENQNKHALEIARQGGQLYDKFVAFTEDLMSVGKNLDTTSKSYQEAMKKLSDGRDNLIRKTERLKELGAKSTKFIDQNLLGSANE
ncbi:MAG: DNA recombination protein RmuC [Cyclobacteriaceae bacterium]|nr:DNA recombination protein RmuC [Cyclobacteriaceae bacterium]